jgi:eukaryotic-like serine/threonine-protein kinase
MSRYATRLLVTRPPSAGPLTAPVSASEAQDRLRILAYVALGSFAVVGLLAWLIPILAPPATTVTTGLGVLAVKVMVCSGGLLVLLRRSRSPQVLRWLGPGFVVLVALLMAVAEVILAPRLSASRFGVSGIGIWIVLFPLVYPTSPRSTLAAAMACATSVPLAYGVSLTLGMPAESWQQLGAWVLPLYFCAGLSVVAAFSIHRYRSALEAAKRELRELGRYQLVRRLGSGGMGEVWLARHRLLPRAAAIKFVKAQDGDDAAIRTQLARQFEAEASAISRLTSVHTVTLYDYGISENGERYYVMELLDGTDLQAAVERHGRMPDWRVARILAQACRSLTEAHAQGLIHRDIKPGNIMLCRQGGELDVVKVLDFGLVCLGHGGQPEGTGSTWAGTVGFVAPEVMLGTELIDGRADLYALGCVAWWLLTHQPVFPALTAQEESVLHCTEPVPPTLPTFGIDRELAALVNELLAKRPLSRPVDADTVRRRLEGMSCWQKYDEAAVAAWWQSVPDSGEHPMVLSS